MNKKILSLIKKGEFDKLELKEARDKFPSSAYSTICAFLNSNGGDIILGVKDTKEIVGINPEKVKTIKQDFLNTINDGFQLSPSISLPIEEIKIGDKILLKISVPLQGSQVYRSKNRIFVRRNEGDFDITDKFQEVFSLYLRKGDAHSEEKIYPHLKLKDLRLDLLERAKNMAIVKNVNPAWKEIKDDMELLKYLSLYQDNTETTGEKGFNLAAVLLLGTDELIKSVLPYYRIDMLKRVHDTDRYDDRLDLRTNLIESYDKMLGFVEKHLPDPFFLDETGRISLRYIVFRELVTNFLVHKEYLKTDVSRFVIGRSEIFFENSNNPYINRVKNLLNYKPHSKNPIIANFFREIGRMDELGSGFMKIHKYCKTYMGVEPVIEDSDETFKVSIKTNMFEDTFPKEERIIPVETGEKNEESREKSREKIIELIRKNPQITREEMAKILDLTLKGIDWQIKVLKDEKIIDRVGSNKNGFWQILENDKN